MSRTSRDAHQAVVIGAGPAGSVASIALARRGWRVLLVDRCERGRAKCCGHCLHPRAFALLDQIECGDRVRLVCGSATRRGEVWLVDDRAPRRVANELFDRGGVVVAREVLDATLIDAAQARGVDVQLGVAARAVESDGRLSVAVGDEMLAPTLILGADGLGSSVARTAELASNAVGRKFGFAADVIPTPYHPWRDDCIVMLVARGGYLGIVGNGDGLHLAACVSANGALPTRPVETIAWFVARCPVLLEALGGAWERRIGPFVAAGPMPWRTLRRTFANIALVGDAAGYVEPFTGEGITWAIETGKVLGECAPKPGCWGDEERARYEAEWTSCAAGAHRRCRVVAGLVARPRLFEALGAMSSVTPWLRRRVVRGLVPR